LGITNNANWTIKLPWDYFTKQLMFLQAIVVNFVKLFVNSRISVLHIALFCPLRLIPGKFSESFFICVISKPVDFHTLN